MISQPIRRYSTSDLFEKENPAFKTFHTCLVLFNTELYTLTPFSVTLQTGGVEPLKGISLHSESVKKRQKGVIQYFSWCYLTLIWCNVLITPGWCRVNTNMVYNYTALGVTVTSSLFLCILMTIDIDHKIMTIIILL